MKKIVIAGGTGLIGKSLTKLLKSKGYTITILSRNSEKAKVSVPDADEFQTWNYNKPEQIEELIKGAYGVVNLTGASIARKKWTSEYKKEIYDSRIISTQNISKAINNMSAPPKVFFCASAVGYYGNRGDEKIEEDSIPGTDFLANVCKDWEKSAFLANSTSRVVCGRFGVVLDKSEGALPKLLSSFRIFIGGPLGTGKQWYPWIHIDDISGMIAWIIENENARGVFNMASPNPVTMNEFSKILGEVMNRPSLFQVPEFVLKFILGEMSAIVIYGQRAYPQKALEMGYEFKYLNLKNALEDLLVKS